MKLAFKLAYRNLIGGGIRTWLNVGILSFVFLVILFFNGLTNGWNHQAVRESIAWEFGAGQLLHEKYDPYDPFTIEEGHGILPESEMENLVPVLVRQASIYPKGRMVPVLIKGIEAEQNLLKLPTKNLSTLKDEIPAIIGKRMAKSNNLKIGDEVLMRWRDKSGTFDAAKIKVVNIFNTDVPTVDNGQIWISIEKLRRMTELAGQSSFFIADKNYVVKETADWKFTRLDTLLQSFYEILKMEIVSDSIIYLTLLMIALIAIFDTQVLSIFRRQKEIGTYVSLGMTRKRVMGIFTLEGSMYSIFAVFISAFYGIPLLMYVNHVGITLPESYQEMGASVPKTLYPIFSIALVLKTSILLISSATIVSLIPARKIAKMNPVDALKGKLQ